MQSWILDNYIPVLLALLLLAIVAALLAAFVRSNLTMSLMTCATVVLVSFVFWSFTTALIYPQMWFAVAAVVVLAGLLIGAWVSHRAELVKISERTE